MKFDWPTNSSSVATGIAPAFSARDVLAALRPASDVTTVAPCSRRRRAVAEPISPIAMTPIVSDIRKRPCSVLLLCRNRDCRARAKRCPHGAGGDVPIRQCGGRPLHRTRLRDRARYVLGVRRDDLQPYHPTPNRAWDQRPHGRDRHVRGALLHRNGAGLSRRRARARYRYVQLAERGLARPVPFALRAPWRATRALHRDQGECTRAISR